MNESRDYSQTVFPAVVVVDDAPVPKGTEGCASHHAGDIWRFLYSSVGGLEPNRVAYLFRLQIDVTVPERSRRHAPACTEANDRSAREICLCEPKGDQR